MTGNQFYEENFRRGWQCLMVTESRSLFVSLQPPTYGTQIRVERAANFSGMSDFQ